MADLSEADDMINLYFLGVQSRKIQFSGTLIKKILLYARIHALNMKGAPGWPVGAQKTTKNS